MILFTEDGLHHYKKLIILIIIIIIIIGIVESVFEDNLWICISEYFRMFN